MTLLVILGALAAYTSAGYVVYVPRAVEARTRYLVERWEGNAWWAAAQLDAARAPSRPVCDDDHAAWAAWCNVAQRRTLPEPAPVAALRREAARRWPLYCLIWLPAVVFPGTETS